jgi:hypothetical protein
MALAPECDTAGYAGQAIAEIARQVCEVPASLMAG